MSKKDKGQPSSSRIFKSPTTGDLCTPSQYAAEIICIRYAEKENIGNLAHKFWNKKQKQAYQAQIVCASRLSVEFGEEQLIGYILDNPRIYSLGFYQPHKFIKDGLSTYKLKNKPMQSTEPTPEVEIKEIRKTKVRKNNLLDQLNRIDNGKS